MIEINLSPDGKKQDITQFAGINLSLLKPIHIIVGILSVYLVEPAIDSMYDEDIKKAQERSNSLKKELTIVQNELQNYTEIKQQVKQLQEQEINLRSKISIIKEIVDKRQNPYEILKYIASNIPSSVWITECEIDDKKLKIKAYSTDWKSISKFIENMESAIFFNANIDFSRPEDMPTEVNGINVEPFQIITNIENFK